jgi:hypothetical protein
MSWGQRFEVEGYQAFDMGAVSSGRGEGRGLRRGRVQQTFRGVVWVKEAKKADSP